MSTLKQNINDLLNGVISEEEMKIKFTSYLSDRFDAAIPLKDEVIDELRLDLYRFMVLLSPIQFISLLKRHQSGFDFITEDRIKNYIDSYEDNGVITDASVNSTFSDNELIQILERESNNKANYRSNLDEAQITGIVIKQLANIDDANKVTEAEAIDIVNKVFDNSGLNIPDLVDKSTAETIAIDTFNNNIKDIITLADLEVKVKDILDTIPTFGIDETEAISLIKEELKSIPTDGLTMAETVQLVDATINDYIGGIHSTVDKTTLINYLLEKAEVNKWICEVVNPFGSCEVTEEKYRTFLIAPRSIKEGENIVYTAVLSKEYLNDVVVHLSNNQTITIKAGEKVGLSSPLTPDIYNDIGGEDFENTSNDVYRNHRVYIVNITKVEGLVGYEHYMTDANSVASTVIENIINPVLCELEFNDTMLQNVPMQFKLKLSHTPKTLFRANVKFGDKTKVVEIQPGEFEVTDSITLTSKGTFFAGVTDTIGGNFEKVDYSSIYTFSVTSPGKHVLYQIESVDSVVEGESIAVTLKVNKVNIIDTIIRIEIDGSIKEVVIPANENKVTFVLDIADNIWRNS